MRVKTLAAVLLAGLVTACASPDPIPQQVRFPRVAAPDVQPVTLNPVRWRVMTETEVRSLSESREPVVLFVLDAENYRNLGLNLIEIRRHIEEQRAAIIFLQRVLDERSEPDASDRPTEPPPVSTDPETR